MNLVLASINVINIKRIEAYLAEVAQQPSNSSPLIQKWITSNLRNWLLREDNPVRIHLTDRGQFSLLGIHTEPPWLQGKPLPPNLYYVPMNPKLKSTIESALHHIVHMVVVNQAKDISKVSVDDAIKGGIDKATAERQSLIDQHYETEGVQPFWRDGKFTVVNIKTREGLARESKYMGHCVGMGGHIEGYWGKIETGATQIWSLRDQMNMPHCTMEYVPKDHMLYQIRGKGVAIGDQFNGLAAKYWPPMYAFLNSSECHARVQKILRSELNMNFKEKPNERGVSKPVWESHVHGYRFVKITVKDGGDYRNQEHHVIVDA